MKIFRCMMLVALLSVTAGGAGGDPMVASGAASAEASPGAAAPAATQSEDSPAVARRNACIQRCDVVVSNCSSSVRRGTKNCMKLAATGGVDPFTRRREYEGYYCGYFRGNDCTGAYDQ